MPKNIIHPAPLKKYGIMPNPPKKFLKMLGPSLILIGLGLGSGELILWPYLVANFGLGIIWGGLVGITMQYFLNMEIERYALANGESIFVGFKRLYKKIPYWFILSTLLAWGWPGISAAAASALAPVIGFEDPKYLNIIMLILAGLILTLGPVLYNTVEYLMKFVIGIGLPLIVIIVAFTIKFSDVIDLSKGLVGIGDGYYFLPVGIPLMGFLAAFAYSGAAGNLNLAQSFYIKEKGYGMGKHSGRITSFLTGKAETIKLEGTTFDSKNKRELNKFFKWWKMVNLEHFVVFWGLGMITIIAMALLAHSTLYGQTNNAQGVDFLFHQANVVSNNLGAIWGPILLIITAIMLFKTQLSVIDAAGRIVTENVFLIEKTNITGSKVSRFYYASIWGIILFGIFIIALDFNEPRELLSVQAFLNAFSMFVFSILLLKTNTKLLPKAIHPSNLRKWIIYITFLFFGIFTILVIYDEIVKLLS